MRLLENEELIESRIVKAYLKALGKEDEFKRYEEEMWRKYEDSGRHKGN